MLIAEFAGTKNNEAKQFDKFNTHKVDERQKKSLKRNKKLFLGKSLAKWTEKKVLNTQFCHEVLLRAKKERNLCKTIIICFVKNIDDYRTLQHKTENIIK